VAEVLGLEQGALGRGRPLLELAGRPGSLERGLERFDFGRAEPFRPQQVAVEPPAAPFRAVPQFGPLAL
jgi:hypothetical protein